MSVATLTISSSQSLMSSTRRLLWREWSVSATPRQTNHLHPSASCSFFFFNSQKVSYLSAPASAQVEEDMRLLVLASLSANASLSLEHEQRWFSIYFFICASFGLCFDDFGLVLMVCVERRSLAWRSSERLKLIIDWCDVMRWPQHTTGSGICGWVMITRCLTILRKLN